MFLVARDHNLVLSICRARITDKAGEATVVLEGDPRDLEKAEEIFRQKGVKVENVLGDVLE